MKSQEQEAADMIREVIALLNLKIMDAAKIGVYIEDLSEMDATSMYDKCRAIIYAPVIVRKDIL